MVISEDVTAMFQGQVTGTDDPARSGNISSRARSYIQRASAQLYDRCLSLKIGTVLLCLANASVTA